MSEASSGPGTFEATFNDGHTASSRRVGVRLGALALSILGDAGEMVAVWSYADLRLTDPDGRAGPVRLRLADDDGARLLFADRRALAAIVRCAPQLARRNRFSRAMLISLSGVVGTAALAAFLWLGLPWVARVVAAAVPVSWEDSLGDDLYVEVTKILGVVGRAEPAVCANAAGTAALRRLVTLLSPSPAPYDFRVTVLDVPIANAFALPGGRMVILRGLLDFVEGPGEVAGVLAHEMAHVAHRDGTKAILRQLGLRGVLSLVFGGGTTVTVGETLLVFSFSRDAETQADAAALATLRDARIGTSGLGTFFRRLVEQHGDMTGGLQFLSTHPSSESRIRFFDEAGISGGGPAMPDADWRALRAICAS